MVYTKIRTTCSWMEDNEYLRIFSKNTPNYCFPSQQDVWSACVKIMITISGCYISRPVHIPIITWIPLIIAWIARNIGSAWRNHWWFPVLWLHTRSRVISTKAEISYKIIPLKRWITMVSDLFWRIHSDESVFTTVSGSFIACSKAFLLKRGTTGDYSASWRK